MQKLSRMLLKSVTKNIISVTKNITTLEHLIIELREVYKQL